jgi:hypothetical protein
MPEFHLIKHNGVFKAADHDSENAVKKISEGGIIRAKSVDQRNAKLHRKYFVLIRLAWQNLPEKFDGYFGTKTDLRKELTKLAGFYDERKDFHGNTVKEARSIAYDNMSSEEFEKLYEATVDLVARLLNTDNPTLERQIMEFM